MVRWSHQEVILNVFHFFYPNCRLTIRGLAKRRDTCLDYKLADFAKEGLNKIIFLALSSVERKLPYILLIL